MLKTCDICKVKKDLNDFNKNKSKKDGLQTMCRNCQNSYSKSHYAKNKQYYVDRASLQKKALRSWWREYKKIFFCDCGETHPACIEFHHTENNKEDDVSRLITNGNKKGALKEIEKCKAICSNCHKKLHYELRLKK